MVLVLALPLLGATLTLEYPKILYLSGKAGKVPLDFAISVRGSRAAAGAAPTIADSGNALTMTAKVEWTLQPGAPSAAGDSRSFRFTASVSAFTAAEEGKPREATFALGDDRQTFQYSISGGNNPAAGNSPPSSTSWTALAPPDPLVLTGFGVGEKCASIGVAVTGGPLTGVRLVHSNLLEDAGHMPLVNSKLHVCKGECSKGGSQTGSTDGSGSAFQLDANTVNPLSLCVTDTSRAGVYHGNIYLAAAGRPDPLAIPLDIQVSCFWYKLAGFALICAGVVVAAVVLPMMRTRANRDQELLQAAFRRRDAARLLTRIAELAPDVRPHCVNTQKALDDILRSLTADELDKFNFLSPAESSPLSSTVDSTGFQKFLTGVDAEIANLSAIVDGLASAAGPLDQAHFQALDTIDALSDTADSAVIADVKTAVEKALAPLAALAAASKSLPAVARSGGPNSPSAAESEHELRKDLARRRRWLNAVLVGITVASGVLTLITSKPGFGVPQDYIYCLLWGFGLPIAGQQLTPLSVRSSLFG